MPTSRERRKEAVARKAALKASLPDLLKKANPDPRAAEAALRVTAILRKKPPSSLVTERNIFRAFSPVEIAKSLSLLSNATEFVSLSAPLTALRMKQLNDKKTVTQVAKAFNQNVPKLLSRRTKKAKKSSKSIADEPRILFSRSTVADAAALVLWLLIRLFELSERNREPALALTIALIQSLREIWHHSERIETAELIVNFFALIRRNLKRSIYVDLEDREEITAFTQEVNSELADWARFALLDGRLKDLKTAVRTAKGDERTKILSQLQEACRTHSSQVLPELIEWVAQEIEQGMRVRKPLVAADASQSSDLQYVALTLLNAWDAAPEGERAVRALNSTEQMARELFKVYFANAKGDVVSYDERYHEITSAGTAPTTKVEIRSAGHSRLNLSRYLTIGSTASTLALTSHGCF